MQSQGPGGAPGQGKRRRQRLRRWPCRARSEQNKSFCIIAGTPSGLCWIHSPATPQLARPLGPWPGRAKSVRVVSWGPPGHGPSGVQNRDILFNPGQRPLPGRPLPRCGGGAAPPGGGPPIRPTTPAGVAGWCASKAPGAGSGLALRAALRPAGGAAFPAAGWGPAPHGDWQLRRAGPLWPILPHPERLRQLAVDSRAEAVLSCLCRVQMHQGGERNRKVLPPPCFSR